MKVIFLDVDGVLNSDIWNENHQKEIRAGILVDKYKVKLLKQIIVKTNAVVVLHSGWKFWFNNLKPIRKESEFLAEVFDKYGIEIYDVTPDFSTAEIRETKRFSLVKAKEILYWLREYKNIEEWLVIDDLDLHNEEVKKHQLMTNKETGLTRDDVEKIIRILN